MQPLCQSSQLSRSLESELENAVKTGELKLSAKNLRDFPRHGERYNLQDTLLADLSRNKLLEVPSECTRYRSLERLLLYHNTIKSIPDNITSLKSLMYLDISRNQLSYLPSSICCLTNLQCLVANNNKLVSLPEEIGEMNNLMELDVSCNEIAHLPVQIGDLANLRSLHLRRNHLQEVPVEITYLQLTFLDLAGNRLSSLPVELRFMVTLTDLHLEENPLSCPPANLCGRGRVHIFKYLEIQAIKEDKKRGVLTDGEYRRSYRKTSQLNDMRFGLSADARRKRNTADSGYGSEQPLDRRWSQEFSQETEVHGPQQTEDARRLAHRAISYRPASNSVPVIKPAMMLPPRVMMNTTVDKVDRTMINPSIDRADSANGSTNSSTSPTNSLDMVSVNNNLNQVNISHMTNNINHLTNNMVHMSVQESKAEVDDKVQKIPNNSFSSLPPYESSNGYDAGHDNTEQENETDERRRAAQRVFSKQGSQSASRSVGRLPLPTSNNNNHHQNGLSSKSPSSPHHSGLPPPPTTNNKDQQQQQQQRPLSSIQTYRQFKEQQRIARQDVGGYREQKLSSSDTSGPSSLSSAPTSSSSSSRLSQYSSSSSKIKSASELRTVQKEAVMSYMDRVRPGAAGAPPDIAPPPPPGPGAQPPRSGHQLQPPAHSSTPGRPNNNSNNSQKITAIPTASRSVSSSSVRTVRMNNSSSSLPQSNSSMYQGTTSVNFNAKRDAERAAVQDSHLQHLRNNIESRLKVSLGEDLSAALADGVVLCHIANHVSPRAVSSIHVPSPAVPKLTGAKCRRNVDNFLAACRKIGVREDLICSVNDIMETKRTNTVRVAITVSELLRFYVPKNNQVMNI